MRVFMGSIGVIILLSVAPAFGQELSNAELSQKVADLERRITLLEQLVIAKNVTQTNAPSVTPPANVANWRKIKVGMTEDNIRMILGEPLKITRYNTTSYTWFYSDEPWHSSISFGRNGVDSWTEPD